MKLFSDVYAEKQEKKLEKAISENRHKTKTQILKILKEKHNGKKISIDEIEKVFDQVSQENSS